MLSFRNKTIWQVKISGLSSNITADELSSQFEVSAERIDIPKYQQSSSNCYALINGFENEEQAVTFGSEWNEVFVRGRMGIKCEVNMATDESTINHSIDEQISFVHSYRSTDNDDFNSNDDALKNRNCK